MRVLLYIIGLVLLIISILRNRSKFFCILLLAFMFLLMAYSYGNADYSTYEMYFKIYGNDISVSVLLLNNGLFKILCAIFTKLGLTYRELLIFMTLVGFINLYTVANKFLTNKNLVFAMYFIYPFLMDITQIRNFVAMTFLIKGCVYLIKEEKMIKGCIMFCVYDIIASLFHITFVFYFVLLLVKFINKDNFKYFAPVLLFIEIILFNVAQSFIAILTNIEKTEFYFNENIDIGTLIIIIIYFICNILIMSNISCRLKNELWVSEIYKINFMMLLTIPVIYHSFEFVRLYRNIFFLNYVAIAYLCQVKFRRNKIKKQIIWNEANLLLCAMFGICIFSLYLFIMHDYMDTVFIPVFKLNRLFTGNL